MTAPRQLLDLFDVNPKKSLGQNFLHDPNTLAKIVEIANVQPGTTVLEVGAGTGALTRLLAELGERIITIEIDERLVPILRRELAHYPNVALHFEDILEADISTLIGNAPYQVVANLPYYITSAILRKLLETQPRPTSLTVTVQKEVADRIVAVPGKMGLLSVGVQFYGAAQIATRINRSVFFPRPDVESAVVRIDVFPKPQVDVPNEEIFFQVVRAGFSQKRKQLKNSLASGLGVSGDTAAQLLDAAGIEVKRRAETLALEEWATLARILHDRRR